MRNLSTAIVVSYRPGSWLAPCLQSVVDQADEVILVDNGSDREEASAIGRRVGVRVIRSGRNLGFSPAVNLALRSARGHVVGLLNDDAEAGPGWLASAADVLSAPDVAAVTPKVLMADRYAEWIVPSGVDLVRAVTVGGVDVTGRVVGPALAPVHLGLTPDADAGGRQVLAGRPLYVPVTGEAADVSIDGRVIGAGPVTRLFNHAGSFLLRHGIAGEYGFAAPDDGRFDRRRDCFGFSGTAPVLSARALKRVGPLASRFFAYNEDTDWCLRAHSAGFRVVFDPGATVVHRLSATSGGVASERVRFLAERNALLCLLRNAPLDVIRECVLPRLRVGPKDEVRAAVLRLMPWALATRAGMAARRKVRPDRLWSDWSGRDSTWDDSPVRPGGGTSVSVFRSGAP
jgi:GT2 family glycosyltransferase